MTVHFNLPHIVLQHPEERPYTSVPQMGASKRIPQRDRASHAAFLQMQLTRAWGEAESEFVASHAERNGVYLEFRGKPGFDLVTKSLEDLGSKKIRLCNVRKEKEPVINSETGVEEHSDVIYATVFVSNDKRQHFIEKIEQYATQQTQSGKPKNSDLVNGIEDLRKAIVRSFWLDKIELLPAEEANWIEVWLSGDTDFVENRFLTVLLQLGLPNRPGRIRFPERIVKLVYASLLSWNSSLDFLMILQNFAWQKKQLISG